MKTADHHATNARAADRSAFCTTRPAADRIGVSHRTVQMWVENGSLQAWKTAGGHRRITNESVERLLDERHTALAGGPAVAPAAAPRARPAPPSAGARSVLIVDDDAVL